MSLSPDQILASYAADVVAEPALSVGPPRLLFEYPTYTYPGSTAAYDVHPDGDRFAIVSSGPEGDSPVFEDVDESRCDFSLQNVYLVTNWFQVLQELAPPPAR